MVIGVRELDLRSDTFGLFSYAPLSARISCCLSVLLSLVAPDCTCNGCFYGAICYFFIIELVLTCLAGLSVVDFSPALAVAGLVLLSEMYLL